MGYQPMSNGTYELEYRYHNGVFTTETVTVDGRSQRSNRFPVTLERYVKDRAALCDGLDRVYVRAIKLPHIRPNSVEPAIAKMVYEYVHQ